MELGRKLRRKVGRNQPPHAGGNPVCSWQPCTTPLFMTRLLPACSHWVLLPVQKEYPQCTGCFLYPRRVGSPNCISGGSVACTPVGSLLRLCTSKGIGEPPLCPPSEAQPDPGFSCSPTPCSQTGYSGRVDCQGLCSQQGSPWATWEPGSSTMLETL